MKYAHLEKDTNKILGWYDDEIHLEIPIPNITVNEDDWQTAIDNNANYYENCNFIVKDFKTIEEIEAQRVASIKNKAKEVIEETYPIYKQLNILMSGVVTDISIMNEYITNIRNISNKAEANGIALVDIIWK